VPVVDGNLGRLEQLFLNLLVNAAHAMNPDTLERNRVTISAHMTDDGNVIVDVTDNGRGMPKAVLDRVYDPFFTTKPIGEGSGLGLPICQSIAISLGGSLAIESEVGQGTRVRVALLAYRRYTIPAPPITGTVVARAQRRGRLLIVDDEPVIAQTLAQLLSERHDVDVATSGSRAMERIAEFAHYDVILCDLVMPGMTGMQLHAKVVLHHPEVAPRMRFMTGGAFLPEAETFLRAGNRQAIQKPFDLEALNGLIDAAMIEVA
jgi:CheY-like chemotaxis protein